MRTIILLMFCSVFTLAESCTLSKKATSQDSKNNSDTLFFSMQRTPCYGRCAVYKMNIYKSGYATLEATMNVEEKSGMYHTTFTKEEIKMISDKAAEIKYFDLKDEYDSPVTDLPTVITSININGKKKIIRDRHQSPRELRDFEKYAEEIFMGKSWIGIPEK